MQISKLKEIIVEHKKGVLRFDDLINRDVLSKSNWVVESKEIIVITGVRRSGKSSLMKLIARELLSTGVPESNLLYINFDDDRLISFTVEDFDRLLNAYLELNGPIGKKYFFLDEIQNVKMWEKWINRLYEFENVKIFVTGSNSSMLSSEYSTYLTGRNRQIINFPFSFSEYLTFKNISYNQGDLFDRDKINVIKRELNNFYINGGFPEIVKNEDLSLLEQYFKDILYRDIIVRHGIKNNKEVRELALILSSEIATNQSYQKLKNVLNIKSLTSIKQYIGYFSESYLFFQLGLFSNSLKQQIYNSKKNYCIDIALANSVSFVTSRNEGRLYENIIYLELLRRNEEIYYWKSSSDKEVDFVIKKGTNLLTAIQVSIDISNDATKEREFSALLCAQRELGMDELTVLTKDDEYDIKYHDTNISVKPIWKYLLNK